MLHPERLRHKSTSTFDRLIIVVSAVYPLSGTSQLIKVYQGSAEGVSIISWLSFLVCAILFLIYGIRHHVIPMIITNALWVAVDLAIVIGLLLQIS